VAGSPANSVGPIRVRRQDLLLVVELAASVAQTDPRIELNYFSVFSPQLKIHEQAVPFKNYISNFTFNKTKISVNHYLMFGDGGPASLVEYSARFNYNYFKNFLGSSWFLPYLQRGAKKYAPDHS
jgi:hypothetical protein